MTNQPQAAGGSGPLPARRIAYADPPYPGCAHLYREEAARAGRVASEVDHAELLTQLMKYDAWALSTSSTALHLVLPLCPTETRVMAWVKPFAAFKPNVNPGYAWEPVLVWGDLRKRERSEATVRDWVAANITLQKGVPGAKPREFCMWLFDVLGLTPEDEFDDLFPGSGGVREAWLDYARQTRLPRYAPLFVEAR